jgi:uncharacterized membrane protein
VGKLDHRLDKVDRNDSGKGPMASGEATAGFRAGYWTLGIFFIGAGFAHFLFPEPYVRIIPPVLPWPRALVYISGAAEVAGGFGVLLPGFRRFSAYGLALLLVAVFPANIYMAAAHVSFPGLIGKPWVQWARLPLQIPLILWALIYTRKGPQRDRNPG